MQVNNKNKREGIYERKNERESNKNKEEIND